MRDENRIFPLMIKMAGLWQEYFPDWRFTQLMWNFFSWLGYDPFYMEDDKVLKKFKEFCDCLGG